MAPRISITGMIFSISLAWGLFYAITDYEVSLPSEKCRVQEKRWGTGLYSPFLSLDFFHRSTGIVFGFGVGGFLGTSTGKMDLVTPTGTYSSTESPLSTLTFHVKMQWWDGWKGRHKESDLEF
jgi:hypothetical protein